MDFTYLYSFIIPHRNSPELLNRCLDSIPQRGDIQIIVIDDNSDEDKKPNVSRSDVELVFIDSQHTKGAGKARNVGLSRARGKWLLFADCDDFYNNGFLEILDKYKDRDIDVLYFNYDFLDGQSYNSLMQDKVQVYFNELSSNEKNPQYIKFRSKMPWNKMVSSNFVKKYDIYFEEVRNGNDILFSMFVAFLSEKSEFCKEPLYVYLRNSGSILTKKQSIDDMMCKIEHEIKLVQVYRHFSPDLSHSVFLNVLKKIRSCLGIPAAFKLLLTLIRQTRDLHIRRNEWVDILNSKRNS